jgi:hypothetical protein
MWVCANSAAIAAKFIFPDIHTAEVAADIGSAC